MRKLTKEHKKKLSLAHKGKKLSEETKKKMSEAHKGEKNPMYGKKLSKEIRLKMSFTYRGKDNPFWKGGRVLSGGYVLVFSPNHPQKNLRNYVYEHRLVMEKHIGRYLKPEEIVHHKNGRVGDNRIENLQLFENNAKHLIAHKEERKARQ